MSTLEFIVVFVVAFFFTLCGLASIVLTAVGLPGAWIIIGMALVIELTDGVWLSGEPTTFGWPVLAVAIGLGLLGEVFELVAGMLGAQKGGSTRRGAVGALVGGIVGAILGIPLPVPFVGSIVGAVVGTFIGAVVFELTAERATLRGSIRPATGATIGRILGTLAKLPIVIAIWFVLSIAAWWP